MSENKKKDESDGAEMVTMNELRLAPTSDSPRKSIKSTAVVKYSAVEAPGLFEQLRCNTDLKQTPENWLNTKSSGGLHYGLSSTSGFSSFWMANMFPDCVGEVDVVSDAENIKKLLKIPYSKGPVSMMVHRVENTLLIDEFDIHKHLLRAAESDWQWLKKFFFEHVLTSLSCRDKGLKGMYQKNLSRCALQQRHLVSKFLYHTVAEGGVAEVETPIAPPPNTQVPPHIHWSLLPEPRLELPNIKSNHEYARNVVWTFEDIQMLIGTDMPIFGGTTHPCISLRLRDMKRPISVLTGIDYWLDNLMCNVPEVVMCYHLDGIVQRYELVKTEDLPHLANSKFSPKLIHDVAQNILSFLKSNATKAGHTYWLFKGKDDDAVKLYDLTSLCNDDMEEKEHNPFTVPVAMLIYRVARNMKQQGSKDLGCIRMLLQNCISLLDKEKYYHIVTSAHYMLSDLYLPADTDPSAPHFPDDEGEEEEEEEQEEEPMGEVDRKGETSVEVQSLYGTNSTPVEAPPEKRRPPPVCGSTLERCQQALKHISDGLANLRLLDTRMWHKDTEKPKTETDEDKPKMAHPFQAIPMPYSTLNSKDSMTVSTHVKKEMMQGAKTKPVKEEDWAGHLLTLLYEKALLVLAVLAQDSINLNNYGTALKHVQCVIRLSNGLEKLSELLGIKHGKIIELSAMRSFLLGQTGDACCMIVQNWLYVEEYREEVKLSNPRVEYILQQLDLDVGEEDTPWPVNPELESMAQVLHSSVNCYKLALASNPARDQEESLKRRLGNVHNELGVLYMSQADKLKADEDAAEEYCTLVKKSMAELEAGVIAFETTLDSGNMALLLTNSGRLMRMCAHAPAPPLKNPHDNQEKFYYTKAVNYYQRALYCLGNRKNDPNVWDTVNWELSTTLFNLVVILQDFPISSDKTQEELEKEAGEFLQKALQSCDLDTQGHRLPMYQFRAGSIHHRMASLYHKSFRNYSTDESRRKYCLQLSWMHYDKAADIFRYLDITYDYIRVQVEQLALCEFLAETSNSNNSRRKFFHQALEAMLACRPELAVLSIPPEIPTEADTDSMGDNVRLLRLMEQRLQSLLLNLAKLTAGPVKKNKEQLPPYKSMYALTLHRENTDEDTTTTIATRLSNVLGKISIILDPPKPAAK